MAGEHTEILTQMIAPYEARANQLIQPGADLSKICFAGEGSAPFDPHC